MGFVGAGPSSFCDQLEQELVEALRSAKARDAVSDIAKIKQVVLRFHKDHVWSNPNPPDVQALMLLQYGRSERILLKISESSVVRKMVYASVGCGFTAADHWERLLRPHNGLPIDRVTAIATYIVWQAKQTVDGCGGPTRIARFGADYITGHSWEQSPKFLAMLESSFDAIHREYGLLLHRVSAPDANLQHWGETFLTALTTAMTGPQAFHEAMDEMRRDALAAFEKERSSVHNKDETKE